MESGKEREDQQAESASYAKLLGAAEIQLFPKGQAGLFTSGVAFKEK